MKEEKPLPALPFPTLVLSELEWNLLDLAYEKLDTRDLNKLLKRLTRANKSNKRKILVDAINQRCIPA
jgi:hypothetical protein